MVLKLLILLALFHTSYGTIRGIDPKKATIYTGKQFTCLDGSQSFPANFVNDDYCDCDDGSDEPGTAACPNGRFFCVNKHFKGQYISSSRVDDGVCDCCDGSDEAPGLCSNNCAELGSHMAEQARKIRKEQAIGFNTRLAYVADGKAAKAKRDGDIATLEEELEERRLEMEEREKYKMEVEEPAKAAKEAAKEVLRKEEEEARLNEEEGDRMGAEAELSRMDRNEDGMVDSDELLSYGSSEDSVLPYEEISVIIESGEIDHANLLESLQLHFKKTREEMKRKREEEKKRREREVKKQTKKPTLRDIEAPEEDEEEEMWGEDGKKIERVPDPIEIDEDFDDSYDDYEEEEDEEGTETPDRNTVQYDEETQRLIDTYEEADKLFTEAQSRYDTVKRQVNDLQKLNKIDFGPDEEYFALKGECFEKTIEKYRYKLCPFDRSDQDSTNIGRWDGWGSEGDYSVMWYKNGNGCWQGPQRSTKVKVVCGSENMILSASEPAKCEYAYVFSTPAACTKVQEEHEIHDEL